jgi:hypothetical protein
MSKRKLQITTAVLALIPIATGIVGLSGVNDGLYAKLALPSDPLLDSNMRFFSGVWLGLGLSILWLVPRIDGQGPLFRAIWTMIFVGGIGRLMSMVSIGAPPLPFVGFTLLEIVGAPLFIWWQWRVERRWSGELHDPSIAPGATALPSPYSSYHQSMKPL